MECISRFDYELWTFLCFVIGIAVGVAFARKRAVS